jgi:hypothetical protein
MSPTWRRNSSATRGLLRPGVARLGDERRQTGVERVGVGDVLAQPFAAEADDQAVLAHRLDQGLDPLDPHARAELLDEPDARLGGDAAGAAVEHEPFAVDRAEIAPDGDVMGADLDADAERLEHAPADVVHERVVSEEPEVPRPRAGRDPGRDGEAQPDGPLRRQRIEVRRPRGLQLGRAPRLDRQPAEPVGHQHDDLGRVGLAQLADEFLHRHGERFRR